MESFPRAATREIAALLVGNSRSSLDTGTLEEPYGQIIDTISIIPDLYLRGQAVNEICRENGIDSEVFHLALATEESSYDMKSYIDWPKPLSPEAYYGPVGELVQLIAPHTEADPTGLLICMLTAIGSIIGRGPHVFGGGYHHTNEYVVLTGDSAVARKGTCWGMTSFIMKMIDPYWHKNNIGPSISTGEGLIDHVHDEVIQKVWVDDAWEEKTILGNIEDKRVLFYIDEFAQVLQAMSRPGVTLPSTIRTAWDGGTLGNLNKSSPRTATDAHISIVAGITTQELGQLLGETDAINGFANRFLWVLVKKYRDLPHGGSIPHSGRIPYLESVIGTNIAWASNRGQLDRDSDAYIFWENLYTHYDKQGIYGIHQSTTSRGLQHQIRLSMLFALMDKTDTIRPEHIKAAAEIWRYCSDSARIIFGESTGNKIADRILDELREYGDEGVLRKDLKEKFAKNEPNAYITRALSVLERIGLAQGRKVLKNNSTIDEVWYSVRRS